MHRINHRHTNDVKIPEPCKLRISDTMASKEPLTFCTACLTIRKGMHAMLFSVVHCIFWEEQDPNEAILTICKTTRGVQIGLRYNALCAESLVPVVGKSTDTTQCWVVTADCYKHDSDTPAIGEAVRNWPVISFSFPFISLFTYPQITWPLLVSTSHDSTLRCPSRSCSVSADWSWHHSRMRRNTVELPPSF